MAARMEGEKQGRDPATLDIMDLLNERPVEESTPQDTYDMNRLGNKQVFKRNFHSLSILGLTCILISSWSAVLSVSTFSLINGGRAGTIWVYLAVWIFNMPVAASLAEMASMAPTAGGQYHWISEFAPPRFQKSFSYVSGWLAALGWQTILGAVSFQFASTLLIVISVGMPSYQPKAWHETLLSIFVAIFAICFNIFAAKRLPLFEGVILCCYILGFFAIAIPLWVIAPKASAREVFTHFENNGGWSSIGAACVIGQVVGAAALAGVDSAAHMSEEVHRASTTVPRMMVMTIMVNGFLALVMMITFVFAIQDIQTQFLESTSPYPFIGVFYDATQSKAAAIGMTVPIILMNFSTCINSVMAASRQSWAFARDHGLPFPRVLTRITTVDSTPLPINAMIASIIITIVVALLNLGGSEVVNSFVGLGSAAFGATYSLSIGCVLWRRLFGEPLPPAKWSLGPFGVVINAIAFFYQVFSTIISFFPLFPNVTAKSMNWSSAVFGGVAILAIIYYFVEGRKKYKGPVVRIVKDN